MTLILNKKLLNNFLTFFIISITLLSFSSNNLLVESINYEKIYLSDDIDILRHNFILRFKIKNSEENFLIKIKENNKLKEEISLNYTIHYSYFLNFGNNSLKIFINNNIVIDNYFYRSNNIDTFNFNNIIFLILVIIISYFVIKLLKDYYLDDM